MSSNGSLLDALASAAIDAADLGVPLKLAPDEVAEIARAGPGEWDAALLRIRPDLTSRPAGPIELVPSAPTTPAPRRRRPA